MAIIDLKGKTAAIAGMVGGIIAIASLVLTWISITQIKSSVSENTSGLDLILGSVIPALKPPERYILGLGVGLEEIAIVVLIGGIFALAGGILTVLTRKKALSLLMPFGGILILVAGIWGFAVVIPSSIEFLQDIADYIPDAKVNANVGYGVYASLVGAIFAIIGSLSLISKD